MFRETSYQLTPRGSGRTLMYPPSSPSSGIGVSMTPDEELPYHITESIKDEVISLRALAKMTLRHIAEMPVHNDDMRRFRLYGVWDMWTSAWVSTGLYSAHYVKHMKDLVAHKPLRLGYLLDVMLSSIAKLEHLTNLYSELGFSARQYILPMPFRENEGYTVEEEDHHWLLGSNAESDEDDDTFTTQSTGRTPAAPRQTLLGLPALADDVHPTFFDGMFRPTLNDETPHYLGL